SGPVRQLGNPCEQGKPVWTKARRSGGNVKAYLLSTVATSALVKAESNMIPFATSASTAQRQSLASTDISPAVPHCRLPEREVVNMKPPRFLPLYGWLSAVTALGPPSDCGRASGRRRNR